MNRLQYKEKASKNDRCIHVVMSNRAYSSVISEVMKNDMNETGGIFLGVIYNRVWYVLDAIDPGITTTNYRDFFQWDADYVNHLADRLRTIYRYPVTILGFWHRHPGSMDFFSGTDENTIRSNLENCQYGLLSMLVNIDPLLRMTYYYCYDETITRVNYDHGDEYFPVELLEYASPSQISKNIGTPMALRTKVKDHHILDSKVFPKSINTNERETGAAEPVNAEKENSEKKNPNITESRDELERKILELEQRLEEEINKNECLNTTVTELQKQLDLKSKREQQLESSNEELLNEIRNRDSDPAEQDNTDGKE